eukprot:Skav219443  [mRNA]  locus=scaffold1461:186196:187804:- [translate_table: standard]
MFHKATPDATKPAPVNTVKELSKSSVELTEAKFNRYNDHPVSVKDTSRNIMTLAQTIAQTAACEVSMPRASAFSSTTLLCPCL